MSGFEHGQIEYSTASPGPQPTSTTQLLWFTVIMLLTLKLIAETLSIGRTKIHHRKRRADRMHSVSENDQSIKRRRVCSVA